MALRWSPLTCLPNGPPLTPSGLLTLDVLDGEVELLRRDNMEIRVVTSPLPYPTTSSPRPSNLSWNDRDKNVTLTLTTHRLVFAKSKLTQQIHLRDISSASAEGGRNVLLLRNSSLKINLVTTLFSLSLGPIQLVFDKDTTTSNDRDAMLSSLQKSISRKAWEESDRARRKKEEASRSQSSNAVTKRKVGVDAIIAKNKLKHEEAALISEKAFANDDVDQFLKEATELVGIIHRYVATLEKTAKETADDNYDEHDGDDETKDRLILQTMLEDMGMASALSKRQQTGGNYHDLLARQICDFLRHGDFLKKSGGMMTLTDLYCLFNRARGTNLISPEDLLQSMALMKRLNLGLSKRDFPSGVIVVQDDTFDDQIIADKLKTICEEEFKEHPTEGVTLLDATRVLNVSAILANEHLLAVERMGLLCRDVTLEGTRFFPNEFLTTFSCSK